MAKGEASGKVQSANSSEQQPEQIATGSVRRRRSSRVHPEEGGQSNVARGNGAAAHSSERLRHFKMAVWELFENPQSSKAAFAIALVLLVLIVVSCVAFTLQTINVFYAGDQAVWVAIETVCIIAFTIEYLCRFACAPDRSQFVKGGLNVIDLVAILPFYVEHMLSGTEVAGLGVFRIVRLARVFRLFKLGRYSDGLKTFATTMRQSTRPLAMLLFFMVIAIVLFSSAIYYAERGTWDEVRRQWWRDGNLGRTQLYNQDDDRLQFYTICTGVSSLQIDNNASAVTSSQLQISFATNEPFVGSGVAVRAIHTIIWANLSFAVLNSTASAADRMANISSWANSQSWAAVDAEGASPWVGATCEAQFPLDGKVTECFGDRHTWPNTGTEAVVSWVKNAVVDHAQQMSSEGQDTRHSLEVTVSELTCEEVGCLYCTNPSPFESIPASFYWSAVTMTTVGYGDVYPVTWAGQLIACFTMMTGILILALPITVIGTYFAAEYDEYLRRQKIDEDYRKRVAKFKRAQEVASISESGKREKPEQSNVGAKRCGCCPTAKKGRAKERATAKVDEAWLHDHVCYEPINIYDEMDWIAHRSRAELRATLEGIIRQERDNLVLKLNTVVQRYTKQSGKT